MEIIPTGGEPKTIITTVKQKHTAADTGFDLLLAVWAVLSDYWSRRGTYE